MLGEGEGGRGWRGVGGGRGRRRAAAAIARPDGGRTAAGRRPDGDAAVGRPRGIRRGCRGRPPRAAAQPHGARQLNLQPQAEKGAESGKGLAGAGSESGGAGEGAGGSTEGMRRTERRGGGIEGGGGGGGGGDRWPTGASVKACLGRPGTSSVLFNQHQPDPRMFHCSNRCRAVALGLESRLIRSSPLHGVI